MQYDVDTVCKVVGLTAEERQYASIEYITKKLYQKLPKSRPELLDKTVTIPKQLADEIRKFLKAPMLENVSYANGLADKLDQYM